MDIIEQLARLIEAAESDAEEQEADKETDKQAAERAEKLRKIAAGEMERPEPEMPTHGGALAPASKYASGLRNTPQQVTRSGEGDRPMMAANAFRHINELLKTVSEFIDKHGDIALVKTHAPERSYLDKYKDELEKQKRKDAGQKVGKDTLPSYNKGDKEKVSKLMNDALDPVVGPERRKIAQNVFWQFLQSITLGRKNAWKEKVNAALQQHTEQMIALVKNKFREQGKTVDDNLIKKRVAQKVKETFQMDLDDKTKEKNKQYDEELFMVKEAMMTISKQMQKLNSEEANYEYKPGAFGTPPRIVEKGTELTHHEKKMAAKAKADAEKKSGSSLPAGGMPGVRKKGQGVGSTIKKGQVPTVDTSGDDDDEFEDIWNSLGKKNEAIDIFMNRIIEIAAADYSPRWWDEL